jgi:hypothetical protein
MEKPRDVTETFAKIDIFVPRHHPETNQLKIALKTSQMRRWQQLQLTHWLPHPKT